MRFQGEYLQILLLITSGDIESNSSPKKQSGLKIFHCNLSGIEAHDFTKLPLMGSYITNNNFDIVRSSETFLDSCISNDNNRIIMARYPYKSRSS